jgi:anti-sigma B factor antagonist
MHIEQRSVGDVTIIDLRGKLAAPEGDELLRDKVRSLVQQDVKKIIINLADVPYVDSSGLGGMVGTLTTVTKQGGKLKLLNVTKRINDLLVITKLIQVFEVYDNEKEALGSF